MRAIMIVAIAGPLLGLVACKPAASTDPQIAVESVLACQNAVLSKGFPGASFEQVDAQPGRTPPITGFVVLNGQRTPFTCSLDGSGQVSGVTINGQAR